MRRDQLEHAIRASIEVDVQALNFPEKTDSIDANLGELTRFHHAHGFYVHGVLIDAAVLPAGWRARTVPVSDPRQTRGCTGHCLEAHDLAASKLVAFRDKDRTFVVTLLAEELIDGETLLDRIADLPVDAAREDELST